MLVYLNFKLKKNINIKENYLFKIKVRNWAMNSNLLSNKISIYEDLDVEARVFSACFIKTYDKS